MENPHLWGGELAPVLEQMWLPWTRLAVRNKRGKARRMQIFLHDQIGRRWRAAPSGPASAPPNEHPLGSTMRER
jgi:hypothetical protein